jgi:hypothetical protein
VLAAFGLWRRRRRVNVVRSFALFGRMTQNPFYTLTCSQSAVPAHVSCENKT